MKFINLQILMLCMITFSSIQCQSPNEQYSEDENKIRETIQMYFDGWMTGDTTLVGNAMQSTCRLKFVKDDALVQIDRSDYLSRFSPKPKMKNTEGRILAIDITRGAASAKCEIEKPGRIYTDYFNMLRMDGRWYITDKISTSISTDQ